MLIYARRGAGWPGVDPASDAMLSGYPPLTGRL